MLDCFNGRDGIHAVATFALSSSSTIETFQDLQKLYCSTLMDWFYYIFVVAGSKMFFLFSIDQIGGRFIQFISIHLFFQMGRTTQLPICKTIYRGYNPVYNW